MLKKVEKKMDEHNEKFNRELEIIKKNQIELMNIIIEIKKHTRWNPQIRSHRGMDQQTRRLNREKSCKLKKAGKNEFSLRDL